jgi:hypothetical protein
VFLGREGKTGKVALVCRHADKYTPLGKIPKPLPISIEASFRRVHVWQ